MPEVKPESKDSLRFRQIALSRWENEGGAGAEAAQSAVPDLTNAELVQLRVRVIALESVIIALLAAASESELDLVRDIAAYISPRPGSTSHPLTIQAAAEMTCLAERAKQFRNMERSRFPGVGE